MQVCGEKCITGIESVFALSNTKIHTQQKKVSRIELRTINYVIILKKRIYQQYMIVHTELKQRLYSSLPAGTRLSPHFGRE